MFHYTFGNWFQKIKDVQRFTKITEIKLSTWKFGTHCTMYTQLTLNRGHLSLALVMYELSHEGST